MLDTMIRITPAAAAVSSYFHYRFVYIAKTEDHQSRRLVSLFFFSNENLLVPSSLRPRQPLKAQNEVACLVTNPAHFELSLTLDGSLI